MTGYPDGLIDGLLEVSRLIVAEESLDDTLHRVTEIACRTITGCDGAGVTVERGGHLTTAASLGNDAAQLDHMQYQQGSGPAIEAYETGKLVSFDATDEVANRWPAFAAKAAELGVTSALSIPMVMREHILGVLNIYATTPDAFSDEVCDLANLYAAQAAVAVANSEIYWRTYALTQNLQAALETRDVIGQAKGILMWQHRITADEAFDRLRQCSQRLNIKLRDVADHVVYAGSLPERVAAGD